MSATPVIEIRDLHKVYAEGTPAEVVALRGVSLTVNHGEFVAIMGPSGSGKSTLMNMIGCLDSPTSGSYRCDGVDVAELDAAGRAKLRLQKIGFVFQGFNLLSRQTALENVMMPLVYSNVPVAERATFPHAIGDHCERCLHQGRKFRNGCRNPAARPAHFAASKPCDGGRTEGA